MKITRLILIHCTAMMTVICSAAVPLKWTVETSRLQPVVFDAVRGETLDLEATFQSYGTPLAMAGKDVRIFYQTNGMDAAWWTGAATATSNRIAVTFTPAMDPGGSVVHGFLGSTGDIYRAAFTLRFRNGPGAAPNAIDQPPRVLDLASTTVINPPWPTDETIATRIRNVIAHDDITAQINTNVLEKISGATTSNIVTRSFVEGLGITGGAGVGGVDASAVKSIIETEVGGTNTLVHYGTAFTNEVDAIVTRTELVKVWSLGGVAYSAPVTNVGIRVNTTATGTDSYYQMHLVGTSSSGGGCLSVDVWSETTDNSTGNPSTASSTNIFSDIFTIYSTATFEGGKNALGLARLVDIPPTNGFVTVSVTNDVATEVRGKLSNFNGRLTVGEVSEEDPRTMLIVKEMNGNNGVIIRSQDDGIRAASIEMMANSGGAPSPTITLHDGDGPGRAEITIGTMNVRSTIETKTDTNDVCAIIEAEVGGTNTLVHYGTAFTNEVDAIVTRTELVKVWSLGGVAYSAPVTNVGIRVNTTATGTDSYYQMHLVGTSSSGGGCLSVDVWSETTDNSTGNPSTASSTNIFSDIFTIYSTATFEGGKNALGLARLVDIPPTNGFVTAAVTTGIVESASVTNLGAKTYADDTFRKKYDNVCREDQYLWTVMNRGGYADIDVSGMCYDGTAWHYRLKPDATSAWRDVYTTGSSYTNSLHACMAGDGETYDGFILRKRSDRIATANRSFITYDNLSPFLASSAFTNSGAKVYADSTFRTKTDNICHTNSLYWSSIGFPSGFSFSGQPFYVGNETWFWESKLIGDHGISYFVATNTPPNATSIRFARYEGQTQYDVFYATGVKASTDAMPFVTADICPSTNGFVTSSITNAVASEVRGKADAGTVTQIGTQVAAIGSLLNGDDAHFVSTNYDSVVRLPEAYVEIKQNGNWLTIWKEMTRWNRFVGDDFDWSENSWPGFQAWHTNVTSELSFKADRNWGLYDSETGGLSPEGYTQISSSNLLIAANMAYQRTVTSGGSVWVLQCNSGSATFGGETNGYFRVCDGDGNIQFEIVRGDRREMGADASGITVNNSANPATVIIPYSVDAAEHPTLRICDDLATANWKDETDADCIATVTWSGSSGAWSALVQRKTAGTSLFVKATYMAGGETYIRNAAPVSMTSIYLNGTKYYLGTATISGHTVLTLSTTAPAN